MKKILCAVLIGAALGAQAGMTHRYTFDGSVKDAVGGKHGKPTAVGAYLEAPRFSGDVPAGAVEGAPVKSLKVG